MPITVDWCASEQSFLYMRLEGEWIFEAYRAAVVQTKLMMHSVEGNVDMIAHAVDDAAQTPPLWAIRDWHYVMIHAPRNMGTIIIVPGNSTVRAFSRAANLVLGAKHIGRIKVANTLEDARQIIKKARTA